MKEIIVDGQRYIPADSTLKNIPEFSYKGDDCLAASLIGQYVICRSYNEGVNAGTLLAATNHGVVLGDARRLHYHVPKDKTLSWYEGVALSGLADNCRVAAPVTKIITEKYSLVAVTGEARRSIEEFAGNEQS